MSFSSMNKHLLALFGSVLITLGAESSAAVAQFSTTPLSKEVSSYETTINTSQDLVDIYFPIYKPNTNTESFPIALFLQGALVDKSNYSEFANIVASYGFVVVVPNNFNEVFTPPGFPQGFYSEQELVNQVLDYMKAENSNSNSPIFEIIDISKLVLLGHSYGGIVGLNAIEESCSFPYCTSEYTRPTELVGGAFYGSDYNQLGIFEKTPPINNDGISIALLAGTLDGLVENNAIEETYNQIQNPPKFFISLLGANHYSITNTNNPFVIPDSNSPTLDQNVGIETIARWSALFLRANVLNDEDAFNYLYNMGYSLDTNVTLISQTKSIPESNLIFGLLYFGAFGSSLWLLHRIQ
jgi:dienelactone hydrolase